MINQKLCIKVLNQIVNTNLFFCLSSEIKCRDQKKTQKRRSALSLQENEKLEGLFGQECYPKCMKEIADQLDFTGVINFFILSEI